MKLATFGYTDLKGKKSNRVILVSSMPSNKLSGIDVTELSDEEVGTFANKYDSLHDEFIAKVQELKASYDLKFNYRQFLESGITDLTTETI
jgi:hypothetical protein